MTRKNFTVSISRKYARLLSRLKEETGIKGDCEIVYASLEYFAEKNGIDVKKIFKEIGEGNNEH